MVDGRETHEYLSILELHWTLGNSTKTRPEPFLNYSYCSSSNKSRCMNLGGNNSRIVSAADNKEDKYLCSSCWTFFMTVWLLIYKTHYPDYGSFPSAPPIHLRVTPSFYKHWRGCWTLHRCLPSLGFYIFVMTAEKFAWRCGGLVDPTPEDVISMSTQVSGVSASTWQAEHQSLQGSGSKHWRCGFLEYPSCAGLGTIDTAPAPVLNVKSLNKSSHTCQS